MNITSSTEASQMLGIFDLQADVGTTRNPGSCNYDAEAQRYAITGAGANIWGNQDDFHFVCKKKAISVNF